MLEIAKCSVVCKKTKRARPNRGKQRQGKENGKLVRDGQTRFHHQALGVVSCIEAIMQDWPMKPYLLVNRGRGGAKKFLQLSLSKNFKLGIAMLWGILIP
ncbi:MAG: hypothetical protein N4A70_16315 [Pelagimonas sp.]|nr:hypothetical protein [Pelagimonas sp.]